MVRRTSLVVCLLCLAAAVIATAINPPLARLPWQDLLWNDLVLANRVAWMSEALRTGPLASVDFLQGAGNVVHSDIKVIPHFYEPAVWLDLFLELPRALDWRNGLLVFYCALCLHRLQRQVGGPEAGERLAQFAPLLAAYVLAPQLLGEVAHHFSGLFYAVPGALLAGRALVLAPRWRTVVGFSAAATLLVHLSDVHIVFIAPTFAVLAWVLDRELRAAPLGPQVLAAAILATVVAASYLAVPASLLHRDPAVVVSAGTWTADYYWGAFLKQVLETSVFPSFAGPICLYVLPLGFYLLVPLFAPGISRTYALRLGLMVAGVAGLVAFGLSLHGVESLRARLPSAMRYHLASIPFVVVLFLLYQHREVAAGLAAARRPAWRMLPWLGGTVLVFFLIARAKFNPESESFLAFQGWLAEPGVLRWRQIGFALLVLLPFAYVLAGLAADRLGRSLAGGLVLGLVLLGATAGGYYAMRAFSLPRHNQVYVDSAFRTKVTRDVPAKLVGLIEESPFAHASRSFVPAARGVAGFSTGRNDKLLPLIELPEFLGGRSFVHWRYSYSAHSQGLYTALTGAGPVNFFPPTPDRIEPVLTFARLTDSPFVLSADAELSHPALVPLGRIELIDPIIARRPLVLNDGLVGTLHLYAVPGVAGATPSADYGRTRARFGSLTPAADGWVRLPVTYFPALRARDSHGRQVQLRRGDDGFVNALVASGTSTVTLTSFSWIGLGSHCSPLAGPLLWAAVGWWPRMRRPPPGPGASKP